MKMRFTQTQFTVYPPAEIMKRVETEAYRNGWGKSQFVCFVLAEKFGLNSLPETFKKGKVR